MNSFYQSLLILTFFSALSLEALAPAGRVLPPIQSSTNINRDRVDDDRWDRDYHKKKDRTRVYNQYYYPYYSGGYYPYSGTYYSGSYYGGYPPYVPVDAFPDDTEADRLFDQLSK